MSCSDKLARWMCLGTQGALLAHLLESSLHLSGLVVSADTGACEHAQLLALQRALIHRVTAAFAQQDTSCCVHPVLPHLIITPRLFRQGKSFSENCQPRNPPAIELEHSAIATAQNTSASVTINTAGMSKRQQKKAASSCLAPKIKPAGNNLNWIVHVPTSLPLSVTAGLVCTPPAVNKRGDVEVTLSSTGILQGCTVSSVMAAKEEEYTAATRKEGCGAKKKRTASPEGDCGVSDGGGDVTSSKRRRGAADNTCAHLLRAEVDQEGGVAAAAAAAEGSAERKKRCNSASVPTRPAFQSRLCRRYGFIVNKYTNHTLCWDY